MTEPWSFLRTHLVPACPAAQPPPRLAHLGRTRPRPDPSRPRAQDVQHIEAVRRRLSRSRRPGQDHRLTLLAPPRRRIPRGAAAVRPRGRSPRHLPLPRGLRHRRRHRALGAGRLLAPARAAAAHSHPGPRNRDPLPAARQPDQPPREERTVVRKEPSGRIDALAPRPRQSRGAPALAPRLRTTHGIDLAQHPSRFENARSSCPRTSR
jgi:hypothetical protein